MRRMGIDAAMIVVEVSAVPQMERSTVATVMLVSYFVQ